MVLLFVGDTVAKANEVEIEKDIIVVKLRLIGWECVDGAGIIF